MTMRNKENNVISTSVGFSGDISLSFGGLFKPY